jgi:hypothetical protein
MYTCTTRSTTVATRPTIGSNGFRCSSSSSSSSRNVRAIPAVYYCASATARVRFSRSSRYCIQWLESGGSRLSPSSGLPNASAVGCLPACLFLQVPWLSGHTSANATCVPGVVVYLCDRSIGCCNILAILFMQGGKQASKYH